MDEPREDRNQLAKTVHIIPLGFEVQRALAPFSNRHIDKAILVVNDEELPGAEKESFPNKQKKYTGKVMSKLEEKKIEIEVVEAKSFDMGELIRVLSSLIRKEKERGNTVAINVSSSGRFASVAAAFAGMAHDIEVYYVVANEYSRSDEDFEKYGVSRCDCKNPVVNKIPNFQLMLPGKEEAMILELLYTMKIMNKGKKEKWWVSLKDIGKVLHDAFPDKYPWDPVEEPKSIKKVGRPKKSDAAKKSENSAGANSKKMDAYQNYRDEQAKFSSKFQLIARDLMERKYLERKEHEKKHVYYRLDSSGEYALFLYGTSGMIDYKDGKAFYNPAKPEEDAKKQREAEAKEQD